MSHQFHNEIRRGGQLPLGERVPSGKFGRMFPLLAGLYVDPEKLKKLGAAIASNQDDPQLTQNGIPAGYTFLGQFIDHDVTFDPTSLHELRVDPFALTNYRTPALDLDNLYGRGPDADPVFYERRLPDTVFLPARFQTGNTGEVKIGHVPGSLPFDLQRAESSRIAVIPDPRNDENLVLGQLHLAMQMFHNAVADQMSSGLPVPAPADWVDQGETLFQRVRETVQHFYQGIVLFDFLPRILKREVLDGVLGRGSLLYRDGRGPYMPVEFSAAAYRFGHGTVREAYEYNEVFSTDGITGAPADLNFLFREAGSNRGPIDLPLLVSDWIIDWRRFFKDLGGPQDLRRNLSLPIRPRVAKFLGGLPGFPDQPNLAARNLIRGNDLRLPSGQSIARYFGYSRLTREEIGKGDDGRVVLDMQLDEETPLWYYVLKEAEQREDGARLGEVGSRIVAEVIVGLLQQDATSVLGKGPGAEITLRGKTPREFTMADLLEFAGFVDPLGSVPTSMIQIPLPAGQAAGPGNPH